MKRKGRGLGKNLDALLAGVGFSPSPESSNLKIRETDVIQIPLEKITPGKYQPRRAFKEEELDELAQSIQTQGVLQPIIVRLMSTNAYEIIAGERRWRASQKIGLSHIPAMVRQVNDNDAMLIALIENIQRSDLTVLEEAIALNRLVEDFQLTHAEISETVGKSRTAVTNLLRILSLNEDVKKLLAEGKLDLGHVKVLLAVKGPLQSEYARIIDEKALSVRQTEKLLSGRLHKLTSKKDSQMDANIMQLQNTLSDKLATKVEVLHNVKGKGKIVIHYYSLEELDGILEHF